MPSDLEKNLQAYSAHRLSPEGQALFAVLRLQGSPDNFCRFHAMRQEIVIELRKFTNLAVVDNCLDVYFNSSTYIWKIRASVDVRRAIEIEWRQNGDFNFNALRRDWNRMKRYKRFQKG